jgi:hypothetical protein
MSVIKTPTLPAASKLPLFPSLTRIDLTLNLQLVPALPTLPTDVY